jgi:hypothetical protein
MKIKVEVIQAHEISPDPRSGSIRLRVGDKIEIEESLFSANLYRRIEPKKSKKAEVKKNGA